MSFTYSFRPDEVHSSGWKLVFNESTVLFQRKSTSTITTTEWEIYIKWYVCQWPRQVFQQGNNLVTRSLTKMTRTVNLQSLLNMYMMTKSVNLQCVLTRTVKKLNLFICGHLSLKNQVLCRHPNQLYHTSTRHYVVTRTVNLQDVSRKKCPVRPVCNDKNCQSANHMRNLNLKELI